MLKKDLKAGELDWVCNEFSWEIDIIKNDSTSEYNDIDLDTYIENFIHRCSCGKLYSDLINECDTQCQECCENDDNWYNENLKIVEDSYDKQREWDEFNEEWN